MINDNFAFPKPQSRVVFVGKTGSGKTTLAEKILSQYKYVVVLDSKGELNWKGYKVTDKLKNIFSLNENKIIWRPNIYETNSTTYELFFNWIYKRKNCIVYIDEVLAICPNSQNIPFWYKAVLTRGRSRNIGCYNATQAPVYVPHWILSQSEFYYVFRTKLFTDREKIEDITGIYEERQSSLEDHQFIWATDTTIGKGIFKLKIGE